MRRFPPPWPATRPPPLSTLWCCAKTRRPPGRSVSGSPPTPRRPAGRPTRMRPLGAGILGHPRLQPRERELLILRTCARAGAEYEWGVHAIAFGGPLGLTERQLAATVHGPADDPAWSEHDAQLIAAADALYDGDAIPDELWAALARRLGDDQLLELVVVAGWYRLLAGVINVALVELEPWAPRFPAAPRVA